LHPGSQEAALTVRQVDIRTSIRPTVARVDLGALRRNVQRVRQIVGPGVAVYGVVKADAYGHGAVAVGRVLAPLCDALAVSLVEEGMELRAAGIEVPVLVLGGYYHRCHSEVLEEGLTPVVYDRGDLERFSRAPVRRRASLAADPRVEIHVKVDTGMHRLGVPPADLGVALDQAASFPNLTVAGICTHFASADVADPAATRAQLGVFADALAVARARLGRPLVVHAANSAGAFRFPEARFDAVRPGVALYGAMPSAVVARPELEPVLTLKTKVMALVDVAPGEGVGYGGLWRAARPSRTATLPIGYADGYPRHVAGAFALIRGRRVPLVGAVSMDMMTVDVTDIDGVAIGDDVTLIGSDESPMGQTGGRRECITVDDVARWAGTVNYEILCGLSKRVPRSYDGDGGDS
jgi:alanine racemase